MCNQGQMDPQFNPDGQANHKMCRMRAARLRDSLFIAHIRLRDSSPNLCQSEATFSHFSSLFGQRIMFCV